MASRASSARATLARETDRTGAAVLERVDHELEALSDRELGGAGRGAAAPSHRQLVPSGEPGEFGSRHARDVLSDCRLRETDRTGPWLAGAIVRRRVRKVFQHRPLGAIEQRERGGDDPVLERCITGGTEWPAERERDP